MTDKTFIGDGVYARREDDAIVLTTEDGVSIRDEIHLDRHTLASLLAYVGYEAPKPEGSWSKEHPTQPGWYWFTPSDLSEMMRPMKVSAGALGNLRVSTGFGAIHPIED